MISIYFLRCWLAKKFCLELMWDCEANQVIDQLTNRAEKAEEKVTELERRVYLLKGFGDERP